jgi:acetylglutamate kinase
MIPKLAAVADALDHGVEAAHVVDGRLSHSVLIEIFTEMGVGTKITA